MKKFLTFLAEMVACAGLMVGVAAAANTINSCSIVNTGSGSNNNCTVTNNTDLTITCTNKTDVVFVNGQNANSGNSVVLNNTTGGYAVSGSAQNVNVVNEKLDVGCGPVVAVAPAPTTPSTPASTAPSPSAAPAPAPAAVVKALPNTGSDSMVVDSVLAIGSLAAAAVVSRFGLIAYRNRALK